MAFSERKVTTNLAYMYGRLVRPFLNRVDELYNQEFNEIF